MTVPLWIARNREHRNGEFARVPPADWPILNPELLQCLAPRNMN